MVLIDNFSLLEVESSIWLHWWGLYKWLELISNISWSSLKSKNSLNWLLSQDWESESGSNVREFLILSPFNIVLISLIVVIVISGWPVSQSLLELELDGQSLSGWFSPSVVVLKEHVVQVAWVGKGWSNLVHVWWNIACLVDYAWSHLGDVHIDQKTVVSINLEKFILSQILGVNIMLDVAVLMGKDNIWMSILVSWGLKVVNL